MVCMGFKPGAAGWRRQAHEIMADAKYACLRFISARKLLCWS